MPTKPAKLNLIVGIEVEGQECSSLTLPNNQVSKSSGHALNDSTLSKNIEVNRFGIDLRTLAAAVSKKGWSSAVNASSLRRR